MTNSRNKGKKGELEIAYILRDRGYDARRGQQYCGANGDADVVGVPGLHIEVKRTEACHPYKYIEQAENDANDDEIPVVFHRQSRKKWIAMLDMETFLKLYEMAQYANLKEDEYWDKVTNHIRVKESKPTYWT